MRLSMMAAALLAGAAPVAAQTVAITNGTVALGDGSEPIQGATVVLRDGRIVAAGTGVAVPGGAEVIDANGKWVTPGIVAGFSRLGLAEVDLGADGSDDTETGASPFSAAIDVAPAINPKASTIAVSRSDGVTRAVVAPVAGRSIFGGQGAVIDTGDDMDAVLRARAFQFVELGEGGAEKAGGSRAASFLLFRNALREARNLGGLREPISGGRSTAQPDDVPYQERQDPRLLSDAARRGEDVLLTRFDAAALVPVVRGRQLLLVHVERAVDILNVLDLRREFPGLRIALVGVTEGWTVADKIAASGVWVIASALNDLPASFEMLAATQSNVGRMRAAGVKVAIGMIDDNDTRYVRNQRQYAGNLVALAKVPGAAGLSWGEAFAMISSRPAEAVGLGGEIGSLARGRRGDVVIWSGDPLELSSAAEAVWIDGVRQPLDNHQTKLRDRYRSLERRDLPEAPQPLWDLGESGWITATLLMWIGSILFIGSLRRNPAFPRPGKPVVRIDEARGVYAITRHPMMWGFALWALVHAMVDPTAASLILCAAIAGLALIGAAMQDAKKEKLVGDLWRDWTSRTSFAPFGRGFASPGTFAFVGGTLVWLVATWAHSALGYRPAGVWAFFA